MILFVSGRTDVVAFYSKWFMKHYKEEYFDVRNPFNSKLISRIITYINTTYPFNSKLISRINVSDIDAILFCTKNPIPILKDIKKIDKPIIFHITLTPYHKDIEPNVPPKGLIIEAIKKLSNLIGIDNICVRYDPIFISDKYTLEYHIKAFDKMCSLLNGYVKTIIVSFLDDYKNVRKNKSVLKNRELSENDYQQIGLNFSRSAKKNNMTVQTCFEERNLVEYGFLKADCLSPELAFKLTGKKYPKWRARKGGNCNCCNMVDIGFYNSCLHMCKYCYANYLESEVVTNYKNHDPNSSLLIGSLKETDIIKIRKK